MHRPDKAPLTRTLDKKEVEDEVAETLGKLGHEATLHVLDGSTKSLHALARIDCDLVFNLAESFGGNDTADYCIAAYLELLDKRITGAGSRGLLYGQDKAVAKKILEFHGIHTPVFARSFRGRLDFSHDLDFPVIVKPAREDGWIGIEFNAVVSSIRELMERIDWLHAISIRRCSSRSTSTAARCTSASSATITRSHCRSSSSIYRSCPRAAADCRGRGEVGQRHPRLPRHEVGGRGGPARGNAALLQQTAVAVFQALELRDYARIDMRLRPDGRVAVIEANPNPWLASKAEFAMAARKSGRNYTQLIEEIVDLAMARYGGRS